MHFNPLVSICSLTYNHIEYIKDAIDGFLLQKTNFLIEILIHDDASTDGTEEIIREYEMKYPSIIKPRYERENQWEKGNRGSHIFNFPRAIGKYIALCEGDDYWTDPYKLQKQVDFLEANPEYGLVHTELDHYFVKSGKYEKNHWKSGGITNQSGDLYDSLLIGEKSMIYACTACFRKSLLNDLPSYAFSGVQAMDRFLWLHIAMKSKIGFINESTAVRRVLVSSATQGRSFEEHMGFVESSKYVTEYFSRLRKPAIKTIESYNQSVYKWVMDICYQFNRDPELFLNNYRLLKRKTYRQWIMYLGMHHPKMHLLTKYALKATSRIYLRK